MSQQAPHASGQRGWQAPSVGLVLAAAGSAILVVAVGVVILLLIRGPGDDGAGADGATALGGETGTGGSSSSSSLSSASTTADADAPPGVLEQCSDSGEPVLPRSGRGTDATSCAFAAAVHEAYFRTARPGDPAMVEARSPTTGQRYEMGCIANHNNGGIICRGGDNAVVFLY